jgi:Tol biopolymer transport system component
VTAPGAAAAYPTTAATEPASPATPDTAAGYPALPGWIVFEHFGQAPDGSTTELDFDNRMIWLVQADGTGLHELAPGEPPTGKISPDVSADGTRIAFGSFDEPRLYEVGIEGTEPALVSTDCDGREDGCQEFEPAYSADGRRMAFVRYLRDDDTPYSVIGVRNLETGDVTLLTRTRADLAEGYVNQPSWSPSGAELVYYRVSQTEDQEHPSDVRSFIAPADGSRVRELPRPDGEWAADPDWSPDGAVIVFSTLPNRESEGWTGGPDPDLYIVRPDGTGLTKLCEECLDGGWAPSWTADGRIMFWGNRSWGLMNADGSEMAHINQPELTWFGDELGYGYAGFLQPTP